MARPLKGGLDYFPLDIDFFDDPKILFVENKFGEGGELVAIKLLTWIYRNGYYAEWNDEICLLFTKKNFSSFKPSFIMAVVEELIKRGFFDESIFNSYEILTSRGLQKRWLNIIRRAKRTAEINPKYDLISSEETPLNSEETKVNEEDKPIITEETPLNREESTQSKVKKSKVKEILSSECREEFKMTQNNHAKIPLPRDKIQELWIKTFGRNPNFPEMEETQKLLLRFGYEKLYRIFKEASLKGFKNLQTLIDALDPKGNIKPKDKINGINDSSNGSKRRGATPEEMARIAAEWP